MDELNASCDRCGTHVRARVEIILPSGGTLYFCGHHSAAYFGDDKDPGVDFTMITQMTFDQPTAVPSPADVYRRA